MEEEASTAVGVHPRVATALDQAFDLIDKVGGELHRNKRRRTQPRTWADSTSSIAMFAN